MVSWCIELELTEMTYLVDWRKVDRVSYGILLVSSTVILKSFPEALIQGDCPVSSSNGQWQA